MTDHSAPDSEIRPSLDKNDRRLGAAIFLLFPTLAMALAIACISLSVAAAIQTIHDPDSTPNMGVILGVIAFLCGIGAAAGLAASVKWFDEIMTAKYEADES